MKLKIYYRNEPVCIFLDLDGYGKVNHTEAHWLIKTQNPLYFITLRFLLLISRVYNHTIYPGWGSYL